MKNIGANLDWFFQKSYSTRLLNIFWMTLTKLGNICIWRKSMRMIFTILNLVNKNNSAKIKFISDHDPEECSECKFVRERPGVGIGAWDLTAPPRPARYKREFLCCEEYHASINSKLLKVLMKQNPKHFHGSFSYRIAAHKMLSNIVHRSDKIWESYWIHEFFDEDKSWSGPFHADHHIDFVLDLFNPTIDEKIQIKVSHRQGIR